MKSKTLVTLSLLVFVFLLGFSFSVQAYAIRQKELNNPVSQYLRENYGVNSIEEYRAKLEQEAWLNYSRQMEALASEYPELNLPQNYMQAGTSAYQPPTLKSEQPFYAVVLGEPVVSLEVFSFSGLSLLGLAAVPPVKKRKQLRQALILGIVVLCVFSVGYFVGLTVAQTGTITIEPNTFQTEASYVIFTDGTTIYARNGTTGAIDYSGTDASTVIQAAINALASGGKIFIKAATYNVDSDIIIAYNKTVIEGEGIYATLFNCTGSAHDVFSIDGKSFCRIAHLGINGNREIISYPDPPTIPPRAISITTGAEHNVIEDVYVYGHADGFGIDYGNDNEIINCKSYNNKFVGVAIGSNTVGKLSERNMVIGGEYWGQTSGIEIFGLGVGTNSYANSTILLGMKIHDNTGSGITVATEANDLLVSSCIIKNNGGSGIQIYTNVALTISKINIHDISSYNNTDGFVTLSAQTNASARIEFVVVGSCNSENDKYFSLMYVANNANIDNINFVGNQWKGVTTGGIYGAVNGGTDITNVLVTGNIGRGTGRGVQADWACNSWTVTDNDFQGQASALSFAGSNYIVHYNRGYVTENSGTTTIANGEYIAHGLDSSLNIGPTNSTVTITPYTVTYAGVPVVVGCPFVNGTHIQISAYWTNGTAITNDAIQVWWKVTYP
jgi:hypothetical protein